jgi:hypothetical protein
MFQIPKKIIFQMARVYGFSRGSFQGWEAAMSPTFSTGSYYEPELKVHQRGRVWEATWRAFSTGS